MMTPADGNARSLSADDTAALFSCFTSHTHILLGVSGGPDSIAMMVLAHEWKSKQRGKSPKISIATVDHGLRDESQDEAQWVRKQARALRLPHAILHWRGTKPKSGIQDAARKARYDLLIAHAREIGADAIVLAHHADDQAETILMRLAAGSGLAGLAGMKAETMRDGFAVLRPFITIPSAHLRASLIARGHEFLDDPSNENSAYARVRVRKARDILSAEGLTRDRLVRLAGRMGRADAALAHFAEAAERRCRMPSATGRLYAPALFEEPFEIRLRVISTGISGLTGEAEPMLQRLEKQLADLSQAYSSKKSMKLTIGGTILSLSASGSLLIRSESGRRKV